MHRLICMYQKTKGLSFCKFSNRGNVQVSRKTKKGAAIALSTFLAASTIMSTAMTASVNAAVPNPDSDYIKVFNEQYDKIHDKSNGYFSTEGVPYHSIETLMVEAPDYGHQTTSEAFSYYTWLEAFKGKVSGDWSGYKTAWQILEKYAIPSKEDQPTVGDYKGDTESVAGFVPGAPNPEDYPTKLMNNTVKTGKDPIVGQLQSAYGDKTIYLMHWVFDVDNWYGYGNRGDGTSRVSKMNTYQRGEQESVWETVVFPSWEAFKWGSDDGTGFLKLFIDQPDYTQQWRYSVASDADARAVQTAYWANKWAKEQGKGSEISAENAKAAKMGDYLRYAMFDKFFKPIGSATLDGPGGTGYDSCHYLMSWYACWGGPNTSQGWSWREGSSASHQGYQNPLAAYALSTVQELKPKSSKGAEDYATSLKRQLEMLQYLQSAEGAIAGGVNNSICDRYDPYPAGTSTFYGMAYDWQPVWHDPPSNRWFGFQTWGLQRLAEYYYETNDSTAKKILDKWVDWAIANTKITADDFEIPCDLEWEGQPETWNATTYSGNPNLHVTVTSHSKDLGITASYANLLTWYAAKSGDEDAKRVAKHLLDTMYKKYRDDKGIAVVEERSDYHRFFDQEVYIPKNWTGKNAQGAILKNGIKFIDQRPKYKQDVNYPMLERAFASGGSGEKFEITYHRFWAQVDIAVAFATFGILYPDDEIGGGTVSPSPSNGQKVMPEAADFDKNGYINIADIMSLVTAFNTKKGDAKYDDKYDLDSNGAVNIADVMMVLPYFNKAVK
jgi:hypothetical protein